MAKAPREQGVEFGSDSFLDVVANVVGILIILVVVVGLRVKQAPAVATEPATAELTAQQRQQAELEAEVLRLAIEADRLEQELLRRGQSRQADAALREQTVRQLALLEQDVQSQTAAAGDLERELWAAQAALERKRRELADMTASTQAKVIKSYPTPISRTVEGDEAHFQLSGGHLAHIPLEELLRLLKTDAPQQAWKLKELPEATSVVGPVGGFRLRYTFARVEVPLEDQLASRRFGSYAQLLSYTLVPNSSQLGEPIRQALAEGSEFQRHLSRYAPRKDAITVWFYPDSFHEFRQLREYLHHLGFQVAGRPLPEGQPIAGSPHGSKSAAQ